jgi:hypothetical protein
MIWQSARVSFRFHPVPPSTQSGQLMCYKNRTTPKATNIATSAALFSGSSLHIAVSRAADDVNVG